VVMASWAALYLVREVYTIWRVRWWYLLGSGRLWRALDWVLFALLFAALRCRLEALHVMGECMAAVVADESSSLRRQGAPATGAVLCAKTLPFPPRPDLPLPDYSRALLPLVYWRAMMALAVAGNWVKVLRYVRRMSICRAVVAGLGGAMWSLLVIALLVCILLAAVAQGLVLLLGASSVDFRTVRGAVDILYQALMCSAQEDTQSRDPSGVGLFFLRLWRSFASLLLPPVITAVVLKNMLAALDSGPSIPAYIRRKLQDARRAYVQHRDRRVEAAMRAEIDRVTHRIPAFHWSREDEGEGGGPLSAAEAGAARQRSKLEHQAR